MARSSVMWPVSRVERDDRLGGGHVRHERADRARPQRAQDRAHLALPRPDADRDRDAPERPRIEGQHALAQGRADEDAIEVEGSDEDLADGAGTFQLRGDLVPDGRRAPGPATDPDEGDIEPIPQVQDGADAGVRLEGVLGRGVVDQPGHHQAVGLRTEGVGDAPERLAFGAGRPVAAGQGHDRGADRRRRILERVGDGADGRPVADPDDRAVADPGAKDLGRQAADHAAGEVLGAGHGRGEMDRVEAVALAQGVGGGRLDGGLVDDADLDDALRPGALQEAAHLGPGDPEPVGDGVLRLTELVVQAARLNELVEVAHEQLAAGPVELHRCAEQMCTHVRASSVARGRLSTSHAALGRYRLAFRTSGLALAQDAPTNAGYRRHRRAGQRRHPMTTPTTIRGFAGEIVEPGHATYDEHREIWNAMVDRRPALIARCTSADDVAAAIRHGRDAGLEIAVKCGGHGVLGLCRARGRPDDRPVADGRGHGSTRSGGGPRSRVARSCGRSTARPCRTGWRRPPATSRTRASAG